VTTASFDPTLTHGRTFWDLVAESFGKTILVVSLAILLLLVVVAVVYTIVMYRRASRENREFTLFPPAIGPRFGALQAGRDASRELSAASAAPHVEHAVKAALGVARAAHQILSATDEAAAADREGYLLYILASETTQRAGVTRRASILVLQQEGDGELSMVLRNGYPIDSFEQPPRPFPKKEYDRLGVGMCWAAVNECTHQNPRDAIVRHVFNVPDVTKERSFYKVLGHHQFESILVAPVLTVLPDGSQELFGVVCLDSDRKEHYNEADQYLVALAALELAASFKAKGRLAHRI
jgi:hypothetical protein